MGRGAHPQLDESLSPLADTVGETRRHLSRHAPLRLWHHHLAGRPNEIDSKYLRTPLVANALAIEIE